MYLPHPKPTPKEPTSVHDSAAGQAAPPTGTARHVGGQLVQGRPTSARTQPDTGGTEHQADAQDQSSDTRGGGGGSAEAKLSHTARKIRHLLTRQFTTAHALQWALSLGERSERRRYQGRNLEWLAREPRAGYESADVRVQPAIEIARSKPAAVCVLRRERDVAAAGALRAHVEARARR